MIIEYNLVVCFYISYCLDELFTVDGSVFSVHLVPGTRRIIPVILEHIYSSTFTEAWKFKSNVEDLLNIFG